MLMRLAFQADRWMILNKAYPQQLGLRPHGFCETAESMIKTCCILSLITRVIFILLTDVGTVQAGPVELI